VTTDIQTKLLAHMVTHAYKSSPKRTRLSKDLRHIPATQKLWAVVCKLFKWKSQWLHG